MQTYVDKVKIFTNYLVGSFQLSAYGMGKFFLEFCLLFILMMLLQAKPGLNTYLDILIPALPKIQTSKWPLLEIGECDFIFFGPPNLIFLISSLSLYCLFLIRKVSYDV